MTKEIKNISRKFISKYKLKKVNFENLKKVANEKGYTVIEFNSLYNSQEIQTVIRNLNLDSMIKVSRGFTYTDRNYRLIFINEDLSESERTIVMSHEIGHIECGHFTSAPIIGNDVKEEYEANEFAHFLLNISLWDKLYMMVGRHKIISAFVALLLVAAITVTVILLIQKKESVEEKDKYYGEYYITETGSKYHTKDCVYIKDKTNYKRLTERAFDSGMYESCSVCLP